MFLSYEHTALPRAPLPPRSPSQTPRGERAGLLDPHRLHADFQGGSPSRLCRRTSPRRCLHFVRSSHPTRSRMPPPGFVDFQAFLSRNSSVALSIAASKRLAKMFIPRADLLMVSHAQLHNERWFIRYVVVFPCGALASRKFANSNYL